MRYGAMNFPVVPVLEEIEAIGRMGMDYVELAMDPPRAHYGLLRRERAAIIKALERLGLGLVCHQPTFVDTAHLSEAIRRVSLDEVIASIETAAELAAEKVVVHPPVISGLAVHVLDHAKALAMESLAQIYGRAQTLGVVLCIENMFAGLGPYVDPEDFQPIFEAFPEMKLVLDTGHAHIGDLSGRRVIDLITTFHDRLEHVHVSDNCGHLDEHLPLGYGSIGFKTVAETLGRVGYDKTITLEIFNSDSSALVQGRLKLQKLLG